MNYLARRIREFVSWVCEQIANLVGIIRRTEAGMIKTGLAAIGLLTLGFIAAVVGGYSNTIRPSPSLDPYPNLYFCADLVGRYKSLQALNSGESAVTLELSSTLLSRVSLASAQDREHRFRVRKAGPETGFIAGDTIISVDGRVPTLYSEYVDLVLHSPRNVVDFQVLRNDRRVTVHAAAEQCKTETGFRRVREKLADLLYSGTKVRLRITSDYLGLEALKGLDEKDEIVGPIQAVFQNLVESIVVEFVSDLTDFENFELLTDLTRFPAGSSTKRKQASSSPRAEPAGSLAATHQMRIRFLQNEKATGNSALFVNLVDTQTNRILATDLAISLSQKDKQESSSWVSQIVVHILKKIF